MPACDGDPSPVPISRPLLCFDQDLACKAKGGSTWHISRTSSSQPMRLPRSSRARTRSVSQASSGSAPPDELILALERRFLETRAPTDLTLMFAAGPGDG